MSNINGKNMINCGGSYAGFDFIDKEAPELFGEKEVDVADSQRRVNFDDGYIKKEMIVERERKPGLYLEFPFHNYRRVEGSNIPLHVVMLDLESSF